MSKKTDAPSVDTESQSETEREKYEKIRDGIIENMRHNKDYVGKMDEAAWIIENNGVKKGVLHGHTVLSSSGKTYGVHPKNGCGCPQARYRDKTCKHTVAVILWTRIQQSYKASDTIDLVWGERGFNPKGESVMAEATTQQSVYEQLNPKFADTIWGKGMAHVIREVLEKLPTELHQKFVQACAMIGFEENLVQVQVNSDAKAETLYDKNGEILATISRRSGVSFCTTCHISMPNYGDWCEHRMAMEILRRVYIETGKDEQNNGNPSNQHDASQPKGSQKQASTSQDNGASSGRTQPRQPQQGAVSGNANARKEEAEERGREKVLNAYATTPSEYHIAIIVITSSMNVGSNANPFWANVDAPYMTVDGRVRWATDVHRANGGTMECEPEIGTSQDGKVVTCKVTIHSSIYGKFTAHAEIKFGGKGSSKDFPIETAETSAYGRALGFMGFGVFGGTGIASADDMKNIDSASIKENHSA